MFTLSAIARRCMHSAAPIIAAGTLLVSCTKHDAPLNDSSVVLTPAPRDAPATAPGTPVRGIIAAVNDTSLTVTTATGAQQIHVDAPLRVYARTSSSLAQVTPNAFVGITSVAEPDGTQRATEIHVFPEELRGTGEGSRMMEATTGGARSTMTNGAVSPSRMTNGAVSTTGGGTSYTVQYQGGSQTIAIPPSVPVTIIAPTDTKLTVGANVVVLTKVAGSRLNASGVMLAAPSK